MSKKPLIFCAIDTADLARAEDLARAIGPVTGGIKLGLEFFSTFGPQGVEKIRECCPGAALFLDLKFHDIPGTVAAAVKTVSENLAPEYLNIHATGGIEMMKKARQACSKKTKLLAVTVLTSLDDAATKVLGHTLPVAEQVTRLALAAHEAGLSGVVCSAHDIAVLRRICGNDIVLMVPGIRPTGADPGDQKRVMTPAEAIHAGATHLVIGRPITGAPDPAKAAQKILESIAA